MDANKSDVWNKAMERLKVGQALQKELLLTCPDSQFDEENARANVAARAALKSACDLIRHNQPKKTPHPVLDGMWAGIIQAAVTVIGAVEMSMYDPRTHPERYKA